MEKAWEEDDWMVYGGVTRTEALSRNKRTRMMKVVSAYLSDLRRVSPITNF